MDYSHLMKGAEAGDDANLRREADEPDDGIDHANAVEENPENDIHEEVDMVVHDDDEEADDDGVGDDIGLEMLVENRLPVEREDVSDNEGGDDGIENDSYDEQEERFVDDYDLFNASQMSHYDVNLFNGVDFDGIGHGLRNDSGINLGANNVGERAVDDDNVEEVENYFEGFDYFNERAWNEEWGRNLNVDVLEKNESAVVAVIDEEDKLGGEGSSIEASDSLQKVTEMLEKLSLANPKRNFEDGSSKQKDGSQEPGVSAAKKPKKEARDPSPNEPKTQ